MDSERFRLVALICATILALIYMAPAGNYDTQLISKKHPRKLEHVSPSSSRLGVPSMDRQHRCGAYNISWQKLFDFVPRPQKKVTDCKYLFPNTNNTELRASMGDKEFKDQWEAFTAYFKEKYGHLRRWEGHSGQWQLFRETATFYRLVRAPFVRTVCETGFNAGHSAFMWLAANPGVHVYSFDMGKWHYSRPQAEFLSNMFPGRLTMTWGNSMTSLRKFHNYNPNVKCDLISIDGGHTAKVAAADLRNFQVMANSPNLLLFDDYPSNGCKHLARIWDPAKESKTVAEFFNCTFFAKRDRGFTVARYLNSDCDTL